MQISERYLHESERFSFECRKTKTKEMFNV